MDSVISLAITVIIVAYIIVATFKALFGKEPKQETIVTELIPCKECVGDSNCSKCSYKHVKQV